MNNGKYYQKLLEDLAEDVEKTLEEISNKVTGRRVARKLPKPLLDLWLTIRSHTPVGKIFCEMRAKYKLFQTYVSWDIQKMLEFFVNNRDTFVNVLEIFDDDYSRELLIKLFATRAYYLVKDIKYISRYVTQPELERSEKDYVEWCKNLKYNPFSKTWRFSIHKFYYISPEPTGVLYLHGGKEKDIIMNKGSVFVDVGAYIGDSSIAMSKYFREVWAFEPFPPNLEYFKKNTAKYDNIKLFPVGLGDKNEVLEMAGDDQPQATAKVTHESSEQKALPKYKIEIEPLDEVVREVGNEELLGENAVIKMDVEGFERFVLKGAKKTISDHAPQLVISAYHLPDDIPVLLDTVEKITEYDKISFRHHLRWKVYEYVLIFRNINTS